MADDTMADWRSDDPLQQAEAGIILRQAGDHDQAAMVFADLIERRPDSVYGWQEMGVLQAMRGELDDALRSFERAVVANPGEVQAREHLVRHLVTIGRADEAWQSIQAHPPSPSGLPPRIALLRQYLDFVATYPEPVAQELAHRFEWGGHYLTPGGVEQAIFAAISDGRPLSLIRLGDGEGAWLTIDAEDEARFALAYAANRRDCLEVWFASSRDYGSVAFDAVAARLASAVAQADIVGLPYGLRLSHEYRVASIRGVMASVNILRALDTTRPGSDDRQAWCSQDVHHALHDRGFFRRLLALDVTFGVISCHPHLGYRLAATYGSRVVEMLIVPEELGFSGLAEGLSAITGISGMTQAHFPFAYYRTLEKLRQRAPGARVWLVAAGFLGKVYCDVVREAGSVAVDVGSIVDGWSGHVTRPYLRGIDHFRLSA